MKTYMYTVSSSSVRGYNRTIEVYRVIKNQPKFIGSNDRINTASAVGDKGEAVKLIGKLCGHKHDNYKFDSKNINLWSV